MSVVSIPISVQPLAPDSSIAVSLWANGELVPNGSSTQSPYLIDYTVDEAGEIELHAEVIETMTDGSTAEGRSATIRVIGALGEAPWVGDVQVPSTLTVGKSATLSVTAGDSDGSRCQCRLLQR